MLNFVNVTDVICLGTDVIGCLVPQLVFTDSSSTCLCVTHIPCLLFFKSFTYINPILFFFFLVTLLLVP